MNKKIIHNVAKTVVAVSAVVVATVVVHEAVENTHYGEARRGMNDWLNRMNDATTEQRRTENDRSEFDKIVNNF